jgi:Holliday junction resolvase RusA-like endonuclease
MFFPDNRARDGQNYMKVLTDYLVSEGVFADDNWRNIVGEQWFSGGIDRENPRVEITIREYKK